MAGDLLFDQLVSEALQLGFSGWDFSVISHRWQEGPTSWDYRQIVRERIGQASSLLDMGTGGGEFLSSVVPLPRHTWATEGYPPNVPVAKARLAPMGVQVVETAESVLPFADGSFDLVINRHTGFVAREVYRVLAHGGRFVTQQVGGSNNIRLNELLQDQVSFEFSYWTLEYLVQQLQEAGFRVISQREDFPDTVFKDIGAVVFYLKIISWQISDFTIEKYRDRLLAIHDIIQERGCLSIKGHRIYVEACIG
ncbi:MAG: class I SAM-dependent methyltransferase [Anaerolineae bacterium]|nr:class I SAM-dependent methyltransferase [Anaerolineae bacterium]